MSYTAGRVFTIALLSFVYDFLHIELQDVYIYDKLTSSEYLW